MALLSYRDPDTGEWIPLERVRGPAGSLGPTGSTGPMQPPEAAIQEVLVQGGEPVSSSASLWVSTAEEPFDPADTDPLYVNLTGDTLTGPLYLAGDPVQPTEAASKQYVDGSIAAHLVAAEAHPSYMNLTGDAMVGPLTLAGDPVQPTEAATRRYVDNAATSHTSAVNPHPQYATKAYVDQLVTVSEEWPEDAVPPRDGVFWVTV
jgi:hypothetical protein